MERETQESAPIRFQGQSLPALGETKFTGSEGRHESLDPRDLLQDGRWLPPHVVLQRSGPRCPLCSLTSGPMGIRNLWVLAVAF